MLFLKYCTLFYQTKQAMTALFIFKAEIITPRVLIKNACGNFADVMRFQYIWRIIFFY
jgi:hypothetical protein